MKPFLFLLLFALIHFAIPGLAQNKVPAIVTTQSYTRGIYQSFAEFLNNAPSIRDGFAINPPTFLHSSHELVFTDSALKSKPTRSFWGYSDGKDVFIKEGVLGGYRKLDGIGRYCYWIGSVQSRVASTPGSPFVGGGGMVNGPLILNINNGNHYELSKAMMFDILKDDAMLLNQYKNEKGKGNADVMFEYIGRYNKTHQKEIGRIDKDASVILYRRGKKEKADSLVIMTTDSVAYTLGINQSVRFKLTQLITTLCVDNACQDFALSTSVLNYIECSYPLDGKRPTLKYVEPRVGEFYLNEIQGKAGKGKSKDAGEK